MVKKGMDWGVLMLNRKWVVCLERVIRVGGGCFDLELGPSLITGGECSVSLR